MPLQRVVHPLMRNRTASNSARAKKAVAARRAKINLAKSYISENSLRSLSPASSIVHTISTSRFRLPLLPPPPLSLPPSPVSLGPWIPARRRIESATQSRTRGLGGTPCATSQNSMRRTFLSPPSSRRHEEPDNVYEYECPE